MEHKIYLKQIPSLQKKQMKEFLDPQLNPMKMELDRKCLLMLKKD